MLVSMLIYCALGSVAGILAGLLGVGGGIVIVPMLVFAFNWQGIPPDLIMLLALGTSMSSIVFTSISSSRAHSRNGNVDWGAVRTIAPGIVAGTLCGTYLASILPTRFLQIFFVAFLMFVAIQMLGNKKPRPSRHLPGLGGMSAAGGAIGLTSGIVGIGGGTLSVPFLIWNNVDMRKAIGTSAAIGFPIAVAGSLGYLVNGWSDPRLPSWSLGYIYLPALIGIVVFSMVTVPFGARLAQALPVPRLRKCFAVLLVAVGARMLFNAL